MKRNFDKILLGILWLMTVALAATFWMNMRYGFDIFSAAHWEYLSELQATRTNIKPEFYVSLVVAIILALTGLYLIVRPRFRKIPFLVQPKPQPQVIEPQQPATTQPTVLSSYGPPPSAQARPLSPALNRVATKQKRFSPPTQQLNTQPSLSAQPTGMAPTKSNNNHSPFAMEMNRIFESAGYIMKPCKHIGKLNNPIVALGYDQTLWIGASSASVTDVVDAFQTLVTLFEETLGDSADDIHLRGCLIAPTGTTRHELISTFSDLQQFKKFMSENQNTQPKDFDKELFDAISTYISTVTNYIGKN
ncbi:MAG: hypothetical protein J5742_00350 [Alphaproteobacteria bacterium]|nr:hypothetical protein [Alphaproteobacteria bacterium]